MTNEERRADLTDRIATIALTEGLDALALRGLAGRLETSSRMLLYYFQTKEALVTAALVRISEQMAELLRSIEEAPPCMPGALMEQVLTAFAASEFAPFLRIWTEVVSRGGRGEAPYDAISQIIVQRWVAWTEARLVPGSHGHAHAVAISLLAMVDGLTLLEMASPGCTEGARKMLPVVCRGLE